MDVFKGWAVTRHLPGDALWQLDSSLLNLGAGAVGWYSSWARSPGSDSWGGNLLRMNRMGKELAVVMETNSG